MRYVILYFGKGLNEPADIFRRIELSCPKDELLRQMIRLLYFCKALAIGNHLKAVWVISIVYWYHFFWLNLNKLYYVFLNSIRNCDDRISIATVEGSEGVGVPSVIPEVGLWNHKPFGTVEDKYFLCLRKKWHSKLWIKNDIE